MQTLYQIQTSCVKPAKSHHMFETCLIIFTTFYVFVILFLFFALDLFATITKIYQPGNQLKSTTWTETQSQTTSKVWITRDRSTGLGTHVQFLCLVCWLWAKLFEEHLHIKITKTIGCTVVWNSSSEGTFKMFKVCLTNSQLNWRLVKIFQNINPNKFCEHVGRHDFCCWTITTISMFVQTLPKPKSPTFVNTYSLCAEFTPLESIGWGNRFWSTVLSAIAQIHWAHLSHTSKKDMFGFTSCDPSSAVICHVLMLCFSSTMVKSAAAANSVLSVGTTSGASLEVRFSAHPSTFFSCASNVEMHQRHTSQHRVGNKGVEQGRPQLLSKNHISFRCQNEPKTSPLYLIMTIFPFLLCWWKKSRVSKACNRGASRLGEAWPRPRLGRKTYWHKDKARLPGARNYIILVLKSQQGWTWSS